MFVCILVPAKVRVISHPHFVDDLLDCAMSDSVGVSTYAINTIVLVVEYPEGRAAVLQRYVALLY